ncbi:Peptidase OS=Kitasatospora aureofaciens OX=1894 GN=GCM10010502_10760 PE=4 SV=1 [Kitasatospora aureofaciens]
MEIVVHDTASAMLELLRRPVGERAGALREMYRPLEGAMSRVMGPVDLVGLHQAMGSGFRLDRDDERYLPAVRRMREEGVWSRVEESVRAAWQRIDAAVPGVRHAETVHVVLVLGNPDDEHLTVRSGGYFGMGGIPGAIQLVIWPTETSLAKIGHAAAHEVHHNVRYANVVWDPATVTVGEQVVAEGLAEAFVRSWRGRTPWARGRRRSPAPSWTARTSGSRPRST